MLRCRSWQPPRRLLHHVSANLFTRRAYSPVLHSNTALEMLGGKPGMKLVRFFSLSDACWYFVQEYMEDRVGVPVLQEEEDGYGDDWKPAR